MRNGMLECIIAVLLYVSGMNAVAYGPTWTPMFKGIDHAELSSEPLVNVLRIDLNDPGISFYTTPTNTGAYETDTQTASGFLTANDVQVAINANFHAPYDGDTKADLFGLAVSDGVLVSGSSTNFEELAISASNLAWVDYTPDGNPTNVPWTAWTAIAGETVIHNGTVWGSDTNRHPRTAVGLSYGKRYLYLLTCDGRQTYSGIGWYKGATTQEVGDWLVQCGAYFGLNLDGGGSTTMVMDNGAGGATLLNVPVDGVDGPGDPPGMERAVGNCLGVYAAPIVEPLVFLDSSFEDDDVAAAVPVKDSTLTAWETISTSAQPDIREENYFGPSNAVSGTQLCYLGGGAIYQNFTDTYAEGATYTLTYWVHRTSGTGTTEAYFTDGDNSSGTNQYGGVVKGGTVHYGSVLEDTWVQRTVSYTATVGDVGDTIGFGIFGDVNVYIDDVVFGASTETTPVVGDPDLEAYNTTSFVWLDLAYDGGSAWDSTYAAWLGDVAAYSGGNYPTEPHSGDQWVGLNGGEMHQAFGGETYVEGYTYTVTAWVAANGTPGTWGYVAPIFTDASREYGYAGGYLAAFPYNYSNSVSPYLTRYFPSFDDTWNETSWSWIADSYADGKPIGVQFWGDVRIYIDDISMSVSMPGYDPELREAGFEYYMPNNVDTNHAERGYDYVGTLHDWKNTFWGSPGSSYTADLVSGNYTNTPKPSAAHGENQATALNQRSVHQALQGTYAEGDTYTLNVWATAASSNCVLYLSFTDGDYANGFLNASNFNLVASSTAIDVPDSGGTTWNQYSYSFTADVADSGKQIGINVYGRTHTWVDDVTVTHTISDPEILGITPVGGDVYEIELACSPAIRATTYPLKKTDLIYGGSWASLAHATNSAGPFTTINSVDYSDTSGEGNPVIYVKSTDAEAFFGLGQ